MDRTDIGMGRGRYPVDLEEEFNEMLIEYWVEGKVPTDMVFIDEDNEMLEVTYGSA